MSNKTERIRDLNDLFRASMRNGKLLMTSGIASLSYAEQAFIIEKVRTFDAFTEDNDPHGEHDFGSFECNGQKIFWKIDYYAPGMEYGSEDPADPDKTVRVLTVMLAEEY